MRALTLYQPLAHLVVHGWKRIEVRAQKTLYRGEFLVHAAASFPDRQLTLFYQQPYRQLLKRSGVDSPEKLVLGAFVGITNLKDCVPCNSPLLRGISDMERLLGDYSRGYAWLFSGTKRIEPPIPAMGHTGFWHLNELPSIELSALITVLPKTRAKHNVKELLWLT